MGNALTVTAIALAWLALRLEGHASRQRDIAEATGTLRAAWHGIVEMREPRFGVVTGWGQIFFSEDYEGVTLLRRVAGTRRLIRRRRLDQVFVVRTEPLERLASTRPSPGLISEATVSAANFALWRVRVFNQLVAKQTAWNVQHSAEVVDRRTDRQRRRALADAAARISLEIHRFGVGVAWARLPDGTRGWYGAFVETLSENIDNLERPRVSWWRSYIGDGLYPLLDLALLGLAVIAVAVAVAVW